MSAPALVLFDLDGTLIDTADEIGDALNAWLALCGLAPVAAEQVRAWIGPGTQALMHQALAARGPAGAALLAQPERLQRASAAFDACYQRCCGRRSRLYPRVRETLLALRRRGTRLALVTNKEGRHAQALLAAHDLAGGFDLAVYGDSLPSRKPDPAGVQACLAHLGLQPEQALFVGDSAIDVATARAAALRVWAVPYGYNAGRPIALSRPDRVIEDLGALL